MSKIKSKNTKCELVLCDALTKHGVGPFKTHYEIIGRPDIAFTRIKLAVFCDSDFWHGKGRMPKSNRQYWKKKLHNNKERDRLVNRKLRELGWKIMRFSEKQILKNTDKCVYKILKQIDTNRTTC